MEYPTSFQREVIADLGILHWPIKYASNRQPADGALHLPAWGIWLKNVWPFISKLSFWVRPRVQVCAYSCTTSTRVLFGRPAAAFDSA